MIESGKGHKTNKKRIVLSLHEKAKLIEESMDPGFSEKEAGIRYGININTVVNILKRKDQILGLVLIENERMAMEIQENNEKMNTEREMMKIQENQANERDFQENIHESLDMRIHENEDDEEKDESRGENQENWSSPKRREDEENSNSEEEEHNNYKSLETIKRADESQNHP